MGERRKEPPGSAALRQSEQRRRASAAVAFFAKAVRKKPRLAAVLCICTAASSVLLCLIISCPGTTSGAMVPSVDDDGAGKNPAEKSLRAAFKEVLSRNSGVSPSRMESFEASLWQTFKALPKNSHGRLTNRVARYILQRHLAAEHGWLIKGLEPHGMRSREGKSLHEVKILRDKAPALARCMRQARPPEHGYSFGDIVTLFFSLERLMLDEALELLKFAYKLNNIALTSDVDDGTLQTIIMSFALLFDGGAKGNFQNATMHKEQKRNRTRMNDSGSVYSWKQLSALERSATMTLHFNNRHWWNPFASRHYSFAAVSIIVEDIALRFGKWQDAECRAMKANLTRYDYHGLGRIHLGNFYRYGVHFSEPADYLRLIGALDDSDPVAPMVIVSNYITGPCNCIAPSTYYSVCCLSECENVLSEIESKMQASHATPDQLFRAVMWMLPPTFAASASGASGTHGSASILAPALWRRLPAIAQRHGGLVPLHGRLFLQWLHFAFPRECAYPYIIKGDGALSSKPRGPENPMTRQNWVEKARKLKRGFTQVQRDAELMPQWSDVEVLPLHETEAVAHPREHFACAVFGALRASLRAWAEAAFMWLPLSLGRSQPSRSSISLPVREAEAASCMCIPRPGGSGAVAAGCGGDACDEQYKAPQHSPV